MPLKPRKPMVTQSSAANSEEIAKVLAALRKRFGEKSVVAGSEIMQPWRIPTGVFEFDLATLGGIPHDRISMVHGPKHSGKSYMAERCALGAQASLPDQKVVWVDIEGTHDTVWSSKIGVDNDELLLVQVDHGEQAVDASVAFVHTREVSLVVVDSLAALLPIKEQEEDADKALVALQSRLITSMLRKLSAAQISERKRGHHVTVLLINQQRTKIGGWSPTGDPISLPGGKALGYFTSLEWRMKNKENTAKSSSGVGDELSHNDHAFTIEKNKLNAGIRSGEFRMMRRADEESGLEEGQVDEATPMLSHAKAAGWFKSSGKGAVLTIEDYEPIVADNTDHMIRTIHRDPELLWHFRRLLIARQAERQGMPDWFVRYLKTGVASEG